MNRVLSNPRDIAFLGNKSHLLENKQIEIWTNCIAIKFAVVISISNQSNTLDSKFFKHDDEKELTEENGISITDMGKMSIYLLIVNY